MFLDSAPEMQQKAAKTQTHQPKFPQNREFFATGNCAPREAAPEIGLETPSIGVIPLQQRSGHEIPGYTFPIRSGQGHPRMGSVSV